MVSVQNCLKVAQKLETVLVQAVLQDGHSNQAQVSVLSYKKDVLPETLMKDAKPAFLDILLMKVLANVTGFHKIVKP